MYWAPLFPTDVTKKNSPRQNVRPECNMNDPLNRFKVLREFMSVSGWGWKGGDGEEGRHGERGEREESDLI